MGLLLCWLLLNLFPALLILRCSSTQADAFQIPLIRRFSTRSSILVFSLEVFSLNFTCIFLPAIFRMEPNAGPFTGNTLVTLILASFDGSDKPFKCKFSNVYNSTEFFIVNGNEAAPGRIQCLTPAVQIPKFAYTYLELSVDGGITYTDEKKVFSFIGDVFFFCFISSTSENSLPSVALSVTSVSLATGPFSGNTLVTVTGTNFVLGAGLRCRFGERVTAATFISSTSVACATPLVRAYPSTDGNVLVSVTSNAQQFAENPAVQFKYYRASPPSFWHPPNVRNIDSDCGLSKKQRIPFSRTFFLSPGQRWDRPSRWSEGTL